MRWLWSHRPQPAMVVSILALIVALGGVAGAQAGLIGANGIANNAIQSRHLAPDAVKSADIAPNAVTTSDIAPGAVRTADIGPGAVRSAQIGPAAVTSTRLAGGPNLRVTRIGNANPGGVGLWPCGVFTPQWTTTDGWSTSPPLDPSTGFVLVPEDGVYDVSLTMPWDATAGGWRQATVALVGSGGSDDALIGVARDNQTAEGVVQNVNGTVQARAGDQILVHLTACHDEQFGVVGFSTDEAASLSLSWVRPLVG